MTLIRRPYLLLIALIGVVVPRRLRADWREEWEAELRHREQMLLDWDRLDGSHRWELLRRSSGAFWDALWLQRQRWEDDVVQDVRFGIRLLLRSPAFTGAAVLTLALGIGINTAIFGVVNALLLRPVGGVPEAGRLVRIGRQYADRPLPSDSTYPDFLDFRDQTHSMAGVAVRVPAAFDVNGAGHTDRVDGELVSSNYFEVLGVRATQGRLIRTTDDRDGAADEVAVLSDRLWRKYFGGQPGAIGAAIRLNGRQFTVVGVADARFTGLGIGTPRDLWIPLLTVRRTDPAVAARFDRRGASWLEMFGRLKPDVNLEQARSDLGAIASRLEHAHPDTNTKARVRVDPGVGRDVETEERLRRFTSVPFAAAAFVLLIACANVAALLLARAASRAREIGTRLALGAARIRVIRQLLTEGGLLAAAGGASGLLVGKWLTRLFATLLPDRYLFLTFDVDYGVDWRVFAFTLAVATATGLLFSVVPAFRTSRPDLVLSLKGSAGLTSSAGRVTRRVLVTGQVALAFVLLIASGLCVQTLRNAAAVDTGYDVAHVLTARLDLGRQDYSEPQGRQFQRQLIEQLQAVPGIEAAALAATLPLNDARWENPVGRAGDPTRIQTFQNVVSSQYFDVMGIPVMSGRRFSDADDDRAPRVAILNETLAMTMWPNEAAVGRSLTFRGRSVEVVGVVRDIKGRDLLDRPGPVLYLPLAQSYESAVVVHLRTTLPNQPMARVVQREVEAIDPNLPVYGVHALEDHVTATLTPQRLFAWVITAFSVLALVLAVVGVYGLVSYSVVDRKPEIALRMALGASRGQIVGLFLAQGFRMVTVGVCLGVAGALVVTRLMHSLLFGVSPADPLTFVVGAVLLIGTSLLACYGPAYRASRVNPIVALRGE